MKKTKTVITADRRKAFGTVKPGVLFPVPDTLAHMPADYGVFFSEIKAIVARERIKAVMAANATMVLMYWDLGQSLAAPAQ